MNKRSIKFYLLISLSLAILSSCTSVVRFSSGINQDTSIIGTFRGYASYYGEQFNGKMTANGEIFNMNKLTAAHRTLPFNTRLKVTNLTNGKSVIVRINDRGPFVANRIIDLSHQAAVELDMLRDGVIEVECQILE